MNRIQLDAAIRSARANGNRDELLAALRVLPDDILFYSLFELASDTQANAPAFDAATILLQLNPRCPLTCVDIVREIAISNWFISIEELPWYVVRQFGLSDVLEAVARVKTGPLTKVQSKVLDTIEYWAKLTPPANQ